MDSDFKGWLYLQFLVGNFEGLYQYYFGSMAYMAPFFRQAGVGIMYSIGLAWMAFCFLKAPVDRLLTSAAVLVMIVVCGFLLSPVKDTKGLGSASGTELSAGGYYAFVVAGSVTEVFTSIVNAAWNASMKEAGGQGGPNKDALAMAYMDKSQEFADKFLKGEGADAYLDFHKKCGAEALKGTKNNEQRDLLKTIGIGANTLGMSALDATDLMQFVERNATNNIDLMGGLAARANIATQPWLVAKTPYDAWKINSNRSKAEQILKDLPPSGSKIDGTKGYRIPTAELMTAQLGGKNDGKLDQKASFTRLSDSDSEYENMLPNGAVEVAPSSDEDYRFYPKNCYDLYLVARDTMANFREGTKDMPEYRDNKLAGAYMSISSAEKVRHGSHAAMNAKLKLMGVDESVDSSVLDEFGDYYYDSMNTISSWFDKWMLDYKIPITISSMAMIVALLLLTFPVFAVLAVVFGPQVLVTYFKLMALPFLVVFINTLLLLLSANIVAYNKGFALVTDTFVPGGVDTSASMASMTAETIVYTVICVAELAIAKFILWDDVRAITSFNPGSAGMNAASRGGSMIGSAMSLIGGAFGKATKLATAGRTARTAQSTSQSLQRISQQVSNIANGGGRSQNSSPFSGGRGPGTGGGGNNGGGAGKGGSAGGITPSGGKPGNTGSPLNPPPKNP